MNLMDIFTDLKNYNFKCEVRLKLFFPASKTEEQTKAQREKELSLQFCLCLKYYDDKRELDDHLKTKHPRDKSFKCQICSRNFKLRCILK